MSIKAVAITDSEEVETLDSIQIWSENETILVLFIRISRDIADSCSESKFRNYIVSVIFFLLSLGIMSFLNFIIRLGNQRALLMSTTFR
jgi:hypothetical protein